MNRVRNEDERRRLLQRLKDEFFLPPLLEHKYRLEEVIGEGSYGVVCSAVNTETGERVAVKRIMRVFEEAPEAMRTLRELKFLRLLKHHENIITIKDVLLPSDREDFDDVFVVLELMPTDLTRVLRSRIELSPEHIRWLVFQLTRGIYFMHTSRVFHRDLKPSNILINARCDLRIVDFGLSRAAFDEANTDLVYWTDYVATRWYRAPELIMSSTSNYTTAIDMWSIGCIFAEMLNHGRPMFPGNNPEDQLRRIIDFCGTPSPQAIAAVREPRARAILNRMPFKRGYSVKEVFPHVEDPLALDLLSHILEFDPNRRFSAEQALQHPYLQMDTVVKGSPIDFEEFAFERQNLSISQLRMVFLEEMLKYHPERRDFYLARAEQPVLRYRPVDQASRFRDAMLATQNGMEPPRAWESMPNQRLTHYYEHAGVGLPPYPTRATGTHSQAGSVVERGDHHTQTTVTSCGTSSGNNDADANHDHDDTNMSDGAAAGATPVITVRTSGLVNERREDDDAANGMNEESLPMRYAKYSSVESATSTMAFRHDSGPFAGSVAGRRVSETLDSMIDTAAQEANGTEQNDKVGT